MSLYDTPAHRDAHLDPRFVTVRIEITDYRFREPILSTFSEGFNTGRVDPEYRTTFCLVEEVVDLSESGIGQRLVDLRDDTRPDDSLVLVWFDGDLVWNGPGCDALDEIEANASAARKAAR